MYKFAKLSILNTALNLFSPALVILLLSWLQSRSYISSQLYNSLVPLPGTDPKQAASFNAIGFIAMHLLWLRILFSPFHLYRTRLNRRKVRIANRANLDWKERQIGIKEPFYLRDIQIGKIKADYLGYYMGLISRGVIYSVDALAIFTLLQIIEKNSRIWPQVETGSLWLIILYMVGVIILDICFVFTARVVSEWVFKLFNRIPEGEKEKIQNLGFLYHDLDRSVVWVTGFSLVLVYLPLYSMYIYRLAVGEGAIPYFFPAIVGYILVKAFAVCVFDYLTSLLDSHNGAWLLNAIRNADAEEKVKAKKK